MKATYRDIPNLIVFREAFTGNSMSAINYNGKYIIYSYSTVIAVVKYDGTCHLNTNYYSSTTSRHQNIVKRCFPDFVAVKHEDLN